MKVFQLPAGRCLDVRAPHGGRLALIGAVVSDYSAKVVIMHGRVYQPRSRGVASPLSQVAIGVVADVEMGGRSNPSHKIDASEPQATPLRIAPMLKNR